MRFIIILLLPILSVYGFFWNSYTINSDIKEKASLSNSKIDYYYLLEAKERLEYARAITSLSLPASLNDTLDNFDITTSRNIEKLSLIRSLSKDNNTHNLTTNREKIILDSLDNVITSKALNNNDILSSSYDLDCYRRVNVDGEYKYIYEIGDAIDIQMNEGECSVVETLISAYYSVGVSSFTVPSGGIIEYYQDKIVFDDLKRNTSFLSSDSIYLFKKVKRIVDSEREFLKKVPFFTPEQIRNYYLKYFDSDNKTFIPLTKICEALSYRISQLLDSEILSQTSKDELEGYLPTINTCESSDSLYSNSQNYLNISDEVVENSCIEQRQNLILSKNQILDDLSEIDDSIGILENEIRDLEEEIEYFQSLNNPGFVPIINGKIALKNEKQVELTNKINERESKINQYDSILVLIDRLGDCS